MRFGLALPQYGFSLPGGEVGLDTTAGWARRAEELGFDLAAPGANPYCGDAETHGSEDTTRAAAVRD